MEWMNKTVDLKQIAKTGDVKADLIMKKCKLDEMAQFMEIKSINPKIKLSEIAREFKTSPSTLLRYRRETNMVSPWTHHKITSNYLKKTSMPQMKMIKMFLKK